MSKRITLAFFIAALLLFSNSVLASASSLVNITLPESKTYNSTNLLLDINVNGPISSASYSLNGEKNVSMNPVLILNMENTGTTVPDFSPYSNNGQIINNVVYTPNGKYGGTLLFDGYNSYVSVPDSNSLDVGNAFTISAWIYPYPVSTFPPNRLIINKAGSYYLELNYTTANTAYIMFGFYGQNMCSTGNPSKPLDYCLFQIPSVTSIPVNQWTHVAGTYDGTTMRLFINGVEDNRQEWTSMTVNNITTPITVNKTTSPLLIGTDASAAYTFSGMIDEVRVYNQSLALRSWVSVLNPGFEDPSTQSNSSEYYTDYWRYEPCDEVPANLKCTPHLYWDTSVYRSYNHSMKIVNTNPNDLAWLAQNPNRFKPDVIGGVTYTESVWIKSTNMSKVSDDGFRLLHLWWNSSWQNFDAYYCNYTTKNYKSWTQITCTATAPIGAVKGDFVIELSGPGTVWIDDANFTSSQPMPHWITNGLDNVTVFATASGVVSSDTKIFTVNQAPTYVNLSLNGTENNTTLTYPQNLTAIFSTNVLTATMYRNGTNVSLENDTSIELGAGYYNYTVVNLGNQNYTSSSKTFFANITQATSNCYLMFNPASGSTYPVSLNASCTCTNPEASAVLWKNGTNVTKTENNQIVSLPAGSYNYVCNVSQTQNYTSASNSSFYIINANQNSTNPVRLTINSGTLYSDQNVSVANGTSVTVNCYNVYSNSGSCNLYRDENLTTNNTNETVTLSVGTYAYKVNTSGNANYSANSTGETFYLTVALADGSSCTASNQCSGGYCLHGICRSSSTYCGDGVCDSGESCGTCPGDCGNCQSGGGGGGGGFLGGGILSTCKENWTCTDWSLCINNTQTRTCTDKNKCGTTKTKPILSQNCVSGQTGCKENWTCTDWSACINNTQTRACTDKNKCGTTSNKPTESQNCITETGTTNAAAAVTPTVTPAGLFLDLSTSYWTIAIISGIIIASIIIFISMRKEKEKET